MAGVLLFSLAAFLPVSAASYPEWRTLLVQHLGIELSPIRSPQPWVTLEAWLLTTVSVLWLIHCLARGYHTSDRRFYLKSLSFGIAILAVVAIYARRADIAIPLWRGPWQYFNYFGPFQNRNHFSTLLAVGALLAFAGAYDSFRNRRRVWLLFAAAMFPMFAGLLLNTSRAGIILFFLGLGTWMLVAGFRRKSARRVALFASTLLAAAAGFLLFGKSVMERFASEGGISKIVTSGSRLSVFSDTINLTGSNPFLGVGLGNFEPIFALTKTYSDHNTRNLHPESDWLWFLTECGGIAFCFGLLAFFGILIKMGPFRSSESKGRRERRIRNAAAVGVMLVSLHSAFDTPSHTIGIWSLVCLLGGMALRPRKLHKAEGGASRWGYRACGVFCIIVGSLWMINSTGTLLLPGGTSARELERSSQALSRARDYAGAVRVLSKAIEMKPLQWNYYFDRAELLLDLGKPPQDALADFSRARELEPHSGLLCFRECSIWLKHAPLYAIPALREAMQRDKVRAYGLWGFYGAMLQQLRDFPELGHPLLDLATEPKLKLVYLYYCVTDTDFKAALAALMEQAPNLDSLASPERRQLFRLWYDKGDRKELIAKLEKNAEWKADGWPIVAEDLASKGDFRAAYQVATDYLTPPLESQGTRDSDLAQLRRDFLFNPTDIARGLRLYGALRAKGMIDDAIYTLEKVARLPEPPPSVIYEQAVMYARKNDYSKAWERMKAYLAVVPKDA
jgi:O-antigen ligase/tetratricopeptide (TPR) repeat protein